jgi:hypothetical protein
MFNVRHLFKKALLVCNNEKMRYSGVFSTQYVLIAVGTGINHHYMN